MDVKVTVLLLGCLVAVRCESSSSSSSTSTGTSTSTSTSSSTSTSTTTSLTVIDLDGAPCPEDGSWPSTNRSLVVTLDCQVGTKQRQCLGSGVWSAQDISNCFVTLNSPCAGSLCQDPNAECRDEGNGHRCFCVLGFEAEDAHSECLRKQVYAGFDCSHGEYCLGGSFCNSSGVCDCPWHDSMVALATDHVICVTQDCAADGTWPVTKAGGLQVQPCDQGLYTRRCHELNGTWDYVDPSQCYAFVNRPCDKGKTCLDPMTTCVPDENDHLICQCPAGFEPRDDPEFEGREKCFRKLAGVQQSCAQGETCLGDSVCTDVANATVTPVCLCREGYVPRQDVQGVICTTDATCGDHEKRIVEGEIVRCLDSSGVLTDWDNARKSCDSGNHMATFHSEDEYELFHRHSKNAVHLYCGNRVFFSLCNYHSTGVYSSGGDTCGRRVYFIRYNQTQLLNATPAPVDNRGASSTALKTGEKDIVIVYDDPSDPFGGYYPWKIKYDGIMFDCVFNALVYAEAKACGSQTIASTAVNLHQMFKVYKSDEWNEDFYEFYRVSKRIWGNIGRFCSEQEIDTEPVWYKSGNGRKESNFKLYDSIQTAKNTVAYSALKTILSNAAENNVTLRQLLWASKAELVADDVPEDTPQTYSWEIFEHEIRCAGESPNYGFRGSLMSGFTKGCLECAVPTAHGPHFMAPYMNLYGEALMEIRSTLTEEWVFSRRTKNGQILYVEDGGTFEKFEKEGHFDALDAKKKRHEAELRKGAVGQLGAAGQPRGPVRAEQTVGAAEFEQGAQRGGRRGGNFNMRGRYGNNNINSVVVNLREIIKKTAAHTAAHNCGAQQISKPKKCLSVWRNPWSTVKL